MPLLQQCFHVRHNSRHAPKSASMFCSVIFFGPKPSEGGVTTFDFFYFFSGGATTAGVAYFEQAVDGRRKLVFRSTANACSKFEERINIVKFP